MGTKKTLILSLPTMVAGVIFIIARSAVSSVGVMVTLGILLIIAGALNFIVNRRGAKMRSSVAKFLGTVANIAAVALGVSMIVFNATFATVVPVIFGTVVVMCAVDMIVSNTSAIQSKRLSVWWLIAPALLLALAVYIFMCEPENDEDPQLMLSMGIALAMYGLISIIMYLVCQNGATNTSAGGATPLQISSGGSTPRAMDADEE